MKKLVQYIDLVDKFQPEFSESACELAVIDEILNELEIVFEEYNEICIVGSTFKVTDLISFIVRKSRHSHEIE